MTSQRDLTWGHEKRTTLSNSNDIGKITYLQVLTLCCLNQSTVAGADFSILLWLTQDYFTHHGENRQLARSSRKWKEDNNEHAGTAEPGRAAQPN